MSKSFRQLNPDAQAGIMALIFFVISIVSIIILIITLNKDFSLSEEKNKCEELVVASSVERGLEGYCEIYIGIDNDPHYKYVRMADDKSRKLEDIYIIWETGKTGRY